eukprot:gene7679-12145_t
MTDSHCTSTEHTDEPFTENIFYSTKDIFENEKLKNEFYNHCRKELSTENFRFLESTTQFKHIENPKKLFIKGDEIFKKFISSTSLFELNISEEQIKKVETKLYMDMKIDIHLFDDIVKTIEFLMRDTIMRFQEDTMSQDSRKQSLPEIEIWDGKASLRDFPTTKLQEEDRRNSLSTTTVKKSESFTLEPKVMKKKSSIMDFLKKKHDNNKEKEQKIKEKPRQEKSYKIPTYWEF